MVIRVVDIVAGADTEHQGNLVFLAICEAMKSASVLTLSFEGINTATSSFVNASLVPLLEVMSFSDIKERIKITSSGKQINEMIRTRIIRESQKVAA